MAAVNTCYMCGAEVPADDYICDECWEVTSEAADAPEPPEAGGDDDDDK